MRALQVDRLQRRRGLAEGCKGLSSGSPLPMVASSPGPLFISCFERPGMLANVPMSASIPCQHAGSDAHTC